MNLKDTPRFVIENKILKGRKITFPDDKKSLGEKIFENLRKNPEFVGLTDAKTGETSTFGKLLDDSIRCALWLKKQGIGTGDVVTISTHNNIASWSPLCAITYIGANLNPWFYDWSSESAKHCLHLTKPKIIFANEKAATMLKELIKGENVKTKIIVFGKVDGLESYDDIITQQNVKDVERFECTKVNPNDDCLIMFSSGSTGLPKGVQHSYQGVYCNSYKWGISFEETLGKPSIFTSTFYWITAIISAHRSLLFMCPTIIFSNPSPRELCEVIEKYQIQWLFTGTGITNELSSMEDLARYNLSSLKVFLTGGSKIRLEVSKRMNQVLGDNQFTVVYGTTELGGAGICQLNSKKKNLESTGNVFLDLELKVVDINSGETLGHNQTGELYFKQKYMMKHYLNNPKATEETFTSDGWCRSGDLGYYDKEGNIFIKERIKEVIKYRGHQISPTEIENILLKHPEVLDAIVVPVPHLVDDEHPFAFVIKERNSKVTEDELIQSTTVLGETKRLRGGLVFLENYPLNTSSKIDKKILKEMASMHVIKTQ